MSFAAIVLCGAVALAQEKAPVPPTAPAPAQANTPAGDAASNTDATETVPAEAPQAEEAPRTQAPTGGDFRSRRASGDRSTDQRSGDRPSEGASPSAPSRDGATRSGSGTVSPSGFDAYRVVVDRNIFSRQRTRPGERSPQDQAAAAAQASRAAGPPPPPPEPGTQVVLIGVSFVGDYATAVFEDRRDGSILAAQVGEKLVDRLIKDITLDMVAVDHEGKQIDVVIGRTLAGTEAPVASTSPAAPAAAGGTPGSTPPAASGAPPAATSAATQSILERLRAQRQEQLKK